MRLCRVLIRRLSLTAALLVFMVALFPPSVGGQTDAPMIESIAFSRTDELPIYYDYKLADIIEVTVTFSEVVAVTGTPQIDLTIGSKTRQADYQSGPPSTALVFHYPVADTDEAPDVTIDANALKLNGGSIKKHNADLDADLEHEAHEDPRYRLEVDGITPVLQTAAVHGTHLVLTYNDTLWLYSRTPASDYAVMVNNAERAVIDVSISARAVTLTLASAVAATDQVTVSYTVGTDPIQDKAGNRVAALVNQAVTTSVVGVSSVAISSMPAARQTYAGGEVIEIEVTFSESVTVTGTPQLWLTFDSTGSYERAASYESGSGTTVLVFRYTVAEGVDRFPASILRLLGYDVPEIGDEDPNGLSIAADALDLHDGTIRDSDNQDAILILDALTDVEGHKVDGLWPQLVTDDPLVVNGATLTLRYDEMLDENSVPASDAFAVTVGGESNEVTGVSIDDSTVTLTLLTAVGTSDEVRLSYTAPTGTEATPVQDLVRNKARDFTDRAVRNDTSLPPPPPPPPPPPSGGNGGSGGGGGSLPQDEHGDTPGQATPVPLDPAAPWASITPGQLNSPNDMDYFTLDLPQAGIFVVETTGATDTRGTVWQAGEVLATADRGGERQNFRLSVPVAAGVVIIAVAGQPGAYTLETTLVVGTLENPGPASFQSGIGVISGWVCAAESVVIELNGMPQEAAYGTEREDTEEFCGDVDTGFGLLFNWNRLEDGEHTVVAYVDGEELGRATVRVTTLGPDFLREAEGECVVADFPSPGERVTLEWQEARQNFVIAAGPAPTGENRAGTAGVGYLENPGSNSFQSGIGVISGWVCEAETVEIEFETENGETERQEAGYGTERLDTEAVCGDTDNGFGLLFNWNRLDDGEHTVTAYVDGEELGRATVRVTTLGAEFLRGVEGECVVADFPALGQTVTLAWQQNQQNFVITEVE